MLKHVSVTEAHDLQQGGATFVDVRSRTEFEAGHPANALNVPLLDHDAATGEMTPNPDFLRVMQASFAPDTALLVSCQAGGRSMRAAQMLEAVGFTDVSNVTGGFGGRRDPMGGRATGWAESGLPVETGAPPGRRYEDLAAKAGVDE